MKIAALAAFLLFGLTAFGQSGEKQCPGLIIDGVGPFPGIGKEIVYKAHFTGNVPAVKLEYRWAVHRGDFVERPTGPEVRVVMRDGEQSLLVTLEIKGLPGCENLQASEIVHWDPAPQAHLVDDFAPLSWNVSKDELTRLAARLRLEAPNPPAVILNIRRAKEYDAAVRHAGSIARRLSKLDPSLAATFRIAVAVTGSPRNIMLIAPPPGTDRPECGPKCAWIGDVR
jgi:hypothetical protein